MRSSQRSSGFVAVFVELVELVDVGSWGCFRCWVGGKLVSGRVSGLGFLLFVVVVAFELGLRLSFLEILRMRDCKERVEVIKTCQIFPVNYH